MRNTNLLIGFGFVMGALIGFTLGMIATPYLIEFEEEYPNVKVPKMIDGYGDVYGGLLSALVAFAAAYFVWWIQHRKEERERRELKGMLADSLLRSIRSMWKQLAYIEFQAAINVTARTADFSKLGSAPVVLRRSIDAVCALPKADPILGYKVYALLENIKAQAPDMASSLSGLSNETDPRTTKSALQKFIYVKDHTERLAAELHKLGAYQDDD